MKDVTDDVESGFSRTASGSRTSVTRPFRHPRPVLNETTLIAGFGGNRKVLREVIDIFLVDGPALLAAVQHALQTGDGQALASSAHALKGSVGLFVQAGAFETARQVERTARAGDLERIGPLCASLEADMKALDSALRSLRRHLD